MEKNVSIEPVLDIWGLERMQKNIENYIQEVQEIENHPDNNGKNDANEDHEQDTTVEDFVMEENSGDKTIIHEDQEEKIEELETFQSDLPSMNEDAVVEEQDDSDYGEDEDTQLEVSINYEVKNATSVLLTGTVVLLIMLARGRKARTQQ